MLNRFENLASAERVAVEKELAQKLMDKDGIPVELRKQCLNIHAGEYFTPEDIDEARGVPSPVKLELLYQNKARRILLSVAGGDGVTVELKPGTSGLMGGMSGYHSHILEKWRKDQGLS